ncbi:glycosyltransferase involved in cell wall biosynthesis [Natronospira proteinivora]|uniref:Glycosyltransferase involved in cell wall biosynthesis n=1 Tax=Natronospira proteinivora TaxID=1807133 RepID=A0ABT1G994_9GAMM|nr:glycosyltransferase family 4 protein [Natronospira proteinivora]MCP1727869.1 glycosyltransferase involved in cell wall biosynthesis [Natronospira proteinivora]
MKQVSMVVWNTFETDARVLKEAQTLVEAGYRVTVCALHTPGVTEQRETLAEGIEVRRVLRSPVMLIPSRRRRVARWNAQQRAAAEEKTEAASSRQSVSPPAPPNPGRVRRFLSQCFRLNTQLLLLLALLRTRPDVVHAHDANTLVIGWLAARLSRARLVYDAHEISTDREGYAGVRRCIGTIEKRLMPRADATITTTDMRARFFARAYGVARPAILQNRPRYQVIEASKRLRERLSLKEDWPIIVYQGGLQAGRGLEDLVHAAAEVPEAYFVLIGGGQLTARLSGIAESLDLQARVFFIPTVPLSELLTYTASADIGVQPIRNTCLNHLSTDSNKLFEYAMAGLPVVASAFPEIRRIVQGHEIGRVYDPEQPGELARALNAMVGSAELRARYGANALAHRKALSWEAQEAVLVDLYAGLPNLGGRDDG